MNTTKPKSLSSKLLITPIGRLSYPHLLERNSGGEYPSEKYETMLLMPKATSNIDPLETALAELLKEAFGSEYKSYMELEHPPIRDGDAEEDKGPEYKGHWFLKAKSDNKPQIVQKDPKKIVEKPEDEVYGGQLARLSLVAFAYNKGKAKKGISWSLRNVQIIGGGEPYGSGSGDPATQFDEIKDGDNGEQF